MAVTRIEVEARGLVFDGLAEGPAGGELVLLLHGFPQSAAIWRPALRTLAAAGYRAVAIDQRGYGRRARPSRVEAYRLDEPLEDAVAVAAALGHPRFHVVGHDWGGVVAWALGAQHPELLLSLTSLATPHAAALGEALRAPSQRLRMAYMPLLQLPRIEYLLTIGGGRPAVKLLQSTGLSAAHARRDIAHLQEVGPEGVLNWYRALSGGPRITGPVSAPTLYIWPDRDPVFTRLSAELTERHVTGPYHYVVLEGASHWIPDEHWEDVADLVADHLAGA